MMRAAIENLTRYRRWPLGHYARLAILGGALGALGEALNLSGMVIGVTVISVTAWTTTRYWKARPRPDSHVPATGQKSRAANA